DRLPGDHCSHGIHARFAACGADISGQSIQREPADQICLCLRTGDPSSPSAAEVSTALVILSDFEGANATEDEPGNSCHGSSPEKHFRGTIGRKWEDCEAREHWPKLPTSAWQRTHSRDLS